METAGGQTPVSGTDHHDSRPGRTIPAHFLPVPTTKTVSPEMQQVVATPGEPWFLMKPQSVDDWNDVITKYNAENAFLSEKLRTALNVRSEAITIAGVPCHRITPAEIAPGYEQRLLLHTHGGAYVFGAGESGLAEAALVAHYSKSPVLSVDYRMPPKHPFPAAVEDVVAVWRKMLESHNPANAAIFGSSAGGGLAMAVTLALKGEGIPLPAALFLGSPWARLDKIADSQFANDSTDNLLITYDGLLGLAAKLYATPDVPLDRPLLSPLEGDLTGFPPSIIITGTRDLFLSLAAFSHRKLRRSGVEAQLHVFEAVSHIQFLFFLVVPPDASGTVVVVPECIEAMTEVARFFDRHLVP